ncbi:hypothetical protein PF001_g27880, partial [Phytophthora fragariae]
WRFQVSI